MIKTEEQMPNFSEVISSWQRGVMFGRDAATMLIDLIDPSNSVEVFQLLPPELHQQIKEVLRMRPWDDSGWKALELLHVGNGLPRRDATKDTSPLRRLEPDELIHLKRQTEFCRKIFEVSDQ